MSAQLRLHEEVAAARDEGRPLVALESTVIAQGLPYPRNLEAAVRMEVAVRAAGAIPAMVAVLSGRIALGLTAAEIERLARGKGFAKASRRDLARLVASGGDGATTVSATMVAARAAGIPLFATGGIGGVHRNAADSLDISADLSELARTPVAVVAAGAKAILDLPATLEVLETAGVPVVGYGTDCFPAFYARDSGLPLEARVDTPAEAAALLDAQRGLGLESGILIANPPPEGTAVPRDRLEGWIAQALDDSAARGVRGKAVTPFLLARLSELSGGETLEANLGLLESNARVAAEIALAWSGLAPGAAGRARQNAAP